MWSVFYTAKTTTKSPVQTGTVRGPSQGLTLISKLLHSSEMKRRRRNTFTARYLRREVSYFLPLRPGECKTKLT